jgi:outer membrane protein assembly factor BamB
LILHCEGIHKQRILALDKSTGQTVWETERPGDIYDKLEPIGKKAYITPIIINVNGQDQLISNGSAVCIAYDPNTGQEIWRVVGGIDSTISMPFSEDGLVFFYTGFMVDETDEKYVELMAVNPEGKGDIGETNVIWKMRTPILQLLTPLAKNGLIYTIDTKSTMMCIEAKTGDILWSKRVRGKYNSSPIYAGGKIYFSSTQGKVIVINEGRELDIIAENELEGEIWTTPVILDGNILIRTSKFLYKIGS